MNERFEFKITGKVHYAKEGLIVLHGDWLGGRVARGDVVTLEHRKESLPLYINAVDHGVGPGKIALACGHAQASLRAAKKGDRLVSRDFGGLETTTTWVVGRAAEKQEDALSAIQDAAHRRACEVLARSVEDMVLALPSMSA
ncbi:hypothetical protein [Polaromonas sp. C04]|uniref:hypothetical protein n=1 Tax=Polaromonas sp. C04 TaxID=1945857 RepID=UPI000986B5C0|nr:hypothetical protein [Polaromonas sp. C04]OOG58017.1 hypothetical protein B0E49_04075 [Polaromonas sp. C04]